VKVRAAHPLGAEGTEMQATDSGAATRAPSHVRGATAPALLDETIGQTFDRICAAHPDALALIARHQHTRFTYAELARHVNAIAAGLLALGLDPGDRVGIWAPNCWEWAVTQYATAKAGLVLVNINPAYRRTELEYALKKVGCKALVLAQEHRGTDYVSMLRDVVPELGTTRAGELVAERVPTLKLVVTLGQVPIPGCVRFDDVAGAATPDALRRLETVAARLSAHDPINIQFTSGTTGAPKGATLSHRNILNNGHIVADRIRLQQGERVCTPLPLYHCFAMVMANLACLTRAACVVYPAEAFEPGSVLDAIEAESCNALYGVPTMFLAVLSHPEFERYDVSSLRTGIMGGSPCPIELMRQVVERMHLREITIAYGMTETSPASFQSSPDDPLDRRVTTVGRVLPHLEVKIVGPDGAIVPRGERGELCTRGYSVMLGYWDDPERTAEVLKDGWMHTGDLATLDDEGYCNIVGRIKDMVIRGGENIYPREIEEFLYRHPAVRDVQVVGVPDAKYGEELCAWLVLKPSESLTEDAVREFCRGQIAHYKIPRYIRFVDAFPMTVTGKVQKFAIRKQMIKELGLTPDDSSWVNPGSS
jgi:fatty-acyl-CoA synthase